MISLDLEDEFEGFMRKVNPDVAETSVQYQESRRVFIAGALAMYTFCVNELTVASEDEALKELGKISAQFKEFQKRVGFNV